MYRVLPALALALLAAPVVRADGLPPPGLKRVPIDYKFTTEKEYPDYQFFTLSGGKGPRAKLNAVKLDPKTPALFPGAGRTGVGRQGALVAVPKGAAKNYETEEKFHLAIKNREVEGMIVTKANLDSQESIKDTDTRTVVVYEAAVEKVDKDGVVLKWKKQEEPKKNGDKKDAPDDDDAPPGANVSAPRGGTLIAGLASALALTLGGLWLVGRTRRKV
jgi:hypothetical protein